jgi:hypothetical protein
MSTPTTRPTAQPLPTAPPATIEEIIAELGREVGVRRGCYPRWAADPQNALTPDVAAHRLACLVQALHLMQQLLPPKPVQGTLF